MTAMKVSDTIKVFFSLKTLFFSKNYNKNIKILLPKWNKKKVITIFKN